MKLVRTISALSLVLLVLISSTSFVVGMHICMGEVQNVALFVKAEGCQKEKSLPPCHKHQKPKCCEDETVVHEANDFKASVAHIHIAAPAALDIEYPLVLVSEIVPTAPLARIQYHNYDPPLRSCDLTIEHQVFLI